MSETKAFLTEKFYKSTVEFLDFIHYLSKEEFEKSINEKWTSGQDLEHLVKTLKLIVISYSIPIRLVSILFGKSNRPGKDWAVMEVKYQKDLAKSIPSPRILVPKKILFSAKAQLISKFQHRTNRLIERITKLTETQLDAFLLPYPLFGKVTLGEMIAYTALHQYHHLALLKKKLGK